MELASHLHMSKAQCQREVSSAEFIEWLALWELKALEAEHRAAEASM